MSRISAARSDAGAAPSPNGPPSIQVGARLFAAKGYAATTTRELSGALGMTNGTFYHYYASKEELLYKICEESLNRMIAEVLPVLREGDGRIDSVKRVIHAHIRTMLSDQDLHRTMLTELRSLSGDTRHEVIAKRDQYSALVQEMIVKAQHNGVLRNDISPHMLTLLLLNLLNWTIFWFNPEGEVTASELQEYACALFLDGARL